MALTILADYLGEKPTREQFDQRESKSWELHFDFVREVLSEYLFVLFDHQIKSWLDQHNARVLLELEIAKVLQNLPISIDITMQNNKYLWSLLNNRGTANTFTEAIKKAFESLMNTAMKLDVPGEVKEKAETA